MAENTAENTAAADIEQTPPVVSPADPPDTAPVNPLDFTGCAALARWLGTTGFFDLAEAMAVQALVKTLRPGAQVAELGTFQGRSSVAMAGVLPQGGMLHCVDHFEGALLQPGQAKPPVEQVVKANLAALKANLERFGVAERVTVYVGRTVEAAGRFAPGSLDLLFVDAGHDYASVRADLAAWVPKLRPGGWLVCDDYEEKWPGVVRAVDETGLAGRLIAPSLWAHRRPAHLP